MDRVGLCAVCKHVRVVDSGRGSRFYMCTEAQRDARLKKYPPLPVLSCFAFVRAEESGPASERSAEESGPASERSAEESGPASERSDKSETEPTPS